MGGQKGVQSGNRGLLKQVHHARLESEKKEAQVREGQLGECGESPGWGPMGATDQGCEGAAGRHIG